MAVNATVHFGTPPLFANSISGRKVLHQRGGVYLLLTASCWSLADLSDANITTVLEGLADAGFNGVTVWSGGGYDINATWQPAYDRKSNGDDWWTGTAWASTLGAAWSAMDHIADETLRLGMTLSFSFCGGFDTTGAGPEWEAATNTNMRDVGIAVANRYPKSSYPNIIWHFMLDDTHSTSSTRGQRIRNLFDGINDTEGASTRPVRWMEPANGATANSQGWLNETDTKATINVIYEYSDSHVVEFETGYAEVTTVPIGDCEPPYDGSSNAGASHAGLRCRVATVFIEGGCLINWGHEDLWTFGKTGLFTESLTYTQVLTHSSTLDAGRIFGLCQTYCAVSDWAPTSSFVTTGEGTTTNKAAQGFCTTAALAYFPNSRSIQVDTTILAGSGNVRLRWWDPTNGTFTSIAASEAQQTGRSVTHPGNSSNSAGASDYILVVDLV